MDVNEASTTLVKLYSHSGWIAQVFIVVFLTLLLNYIQKLVYNRLHKKLHRSAKLWDEILLSAIQKPLGFFIWLVGLSYAIEIVRKSTEGLSILDAVDNVRAVGTVILIVWALLRFINQFEKKLVAHNKKNKKQGDENALDETTLHAVGQLVRISIIITGLLVGLQTFGVPITGLLAFGGVGGIAVGLAAKDLLANFFGGLMVFLDRPFSVGDWIRSPDRNIEGTVEHIGWRLTRIRTFDKRPLYVPNALFSTISVENPSRMMNRRIKHVIGVRYDDASKISQMLGDIRTMLHNHPEIDTNQTLMVNLIEFGTSSLNFFIYTFTKTTDWVKFQAVQEDVLLKIYQLIEKNGAECAFPTQTVHVPKGVALNNLLTAQS